MDAAPQNLAAPRVSLYEKNMGPEQEATSRVNDCEAAAGWSW